MSEAHAGAVGAPIATKHGRVIPAYLSVYVN